MKVKFREIPAESDEYVYHLSEVQVGGRGLGGPTLREILEFATGVGNDEAIHDDASRADEFAEICDEYRTQIQDTPDLRLTVARAHVLHEACMSAWEYADQNNYGDDSEPDDEARAFGRYGQFLLQTLAWPWTQPSLPDDGSHGFTRVT